MLLGGIRHFWLQRSPVPTLLLHTTTVGTCFAFKVRNMHSSAEGADPNSPNRSNPKRVGTHNGSFHCDEALGCFMIRLTSKFKDSQIVRSRDPKILDTLDAVLDVGGVYDPDTDRYDHHQKGFSQVFGYGFDTKLSSAGLVYKVIIFFSSSSEFLYLSFRNFGDSFLLVFFLMFCSIMVWRLLQTSFNLNNLMKMFSGFTSHYTETSLRCLFSISPSTAIFNNSNVQH